MREAGTFVLRDPLTIGSGGGGGLHWEIKGRKVNPAEVDKMLRVRTGVIW